MYSASFGTQLQYWSSVVCLRCSCWHDVIGWLSIGRWNTVLRSDVCRALRETPTGLPAGETAELWWRGVSLKLVCRPRMCERTGNEAVSRPTGMSWWNSAGRRSLTRDRHSLRSWCHSIVCWRRGRYQSLFLFQFWWRDHCMLFCLWHSPLILPRRTLTRRSMRNSPTPALTVLRRKLADLHYG